MSLAAFIVYAIDKRAARVDRRRIRERRLHLLALLGGWPGAWLAQRWLRHKNRKPAFRRMFQLTVVVNIALLLVLASLPRMPARQTSTTTATAQASAASIALSSDSGLSVGA